MNGDKLHLLLTGFYVEAKRFRRTCLAGPGFLTWYPGARINILNRGLITLSTTKGQFREKNR
jgi:hypothetical protein